MPFSQRSRFVPGILKSVCPGGNVLSEGLGAGYVLESAMAGLTAGPRADIVDFMARSVLSAQKTGSGWGAIGGTGIGLCEGHAFLCQTVQAGGLVKIGPHVTGVSPPKIIQKNKQDIGAVRRIGLNGRMQPQ